MKDTVIFDLDGTLADTGADLIAAANQCFRALGHSDVLDPVADKLTAFHGGRAMLRLGFSRIDAGHGEEDVDRAYPDLLAYYGENIDTQTTLYPGAMEAVAALAARDHAVGICTNKPEGLAETLLQKLGVRGAFGSLVGADTLKVRKPDPETLFEAIRRAEGNPARAVLVGDTETDLRTARAAGCPVILVTFGPEGRGVSRLSPDALMADYTELEGLVRGLLGQAPG